MKGVPSSRCTGDGGEVTNYSSLSAAPVFKRGSAFHPGNQAAERQVHGLGEEGGSAGIPRPSIHHKPAATMLTTSFRHVVEDLPSRARDHFVVSAQKFMKRLAPSFPDDDRFRQKKCRLSLSQRNPPPPVEGNLKGSGPIITAKSRPARCISCLCAYRKANSYS